MLRALSKLGGMWLKNKQAVEFFDAGRELVTQGKLTEAKEQFVKVLEIYPTCDGARYQLLQIEKNLKDSQSAKAVHEHHHNHFSKP